MARGNLRVVAVMLVGFCVVLGSCSSGPGVDKLGRPGGSAVVLKVGAADTENPYLQAFVAALTRESEGRVTAQVDPVTYFSETAGGEARLAGDVRSGQVPIGFVPTRDWVTVDPRWQAVQSPFLLTTTAASVAFARSEVAAGLLDETADRGVVPLALIPGEARRLMSREPIMSAADLRGLRIRINPNAQAEQLTKAWSAIPIQDLSAWQTRTALQQAVVDAVETSPDAAVVNSYNAWAPYLTGFGLYPKLSLLLVGQQAWNSLAEPDRAALTRAARDAEDLAVGDIQAREARELAELCRAGAIVVQTSAARLDGFVQANADGPESTVDRALLGRIAAASGTTGIQAADPIPEECPVARTAAEARQQRDDRSEEPSGRDTEAFPVGTYRIEVSKQAWAEGGLAGNPDFQTDITYTQEFAADGTWWETQVPDYPDQGRLSGHWTVDGNVLTATFDPGIDITDEVVGWSYYQGVLTLRPIHVQDQGSRVIYAQPWHRIA